MSTLGLDIGGASLKVATSAGEAWSRRFALWKHPERLAEELVTLIERSTSERIAVTMTGELCDAYQTKDEGVSHILDSLVPAARGREILVWQNDGRFVSPNEARFDAWKTGASNWIALASYVARLFPRESVLLVDIGSTTTDIVKMDRGEPRPTGLSDPDRLSTGELVYEGVRRTPVCAILSQVNVADRTYRVMNELFATTLDAYLMLGHLVPDPHANDTADGRPETIDMAIARLARMIGSDSTRFTREHAIELSQQVSSEQVSRLDTALRQVLTEPTPPPLRVVTSGEGEFLAQQVIDGIESLRHARRTSLASILSPELSRAACAYAVAMLAEESTGLD